jgi:hypothetical protein
MSVVVWEIGCVAGMQSMVSVAGYAVERKDIGKSWRWTENVEENGNVRRRKETEVEILSALQKSAKHGNLNLGKLASA